jgi:hypothetical protein
MILCLVFLAKLLITSSLLKIYLTALPSPTAPQDTVPYHNRPNLPDQTVLTATFHNSTALPRHNTPYRTTTAKPRQTTPQQNAPQPSKTNLNRHT